MIILAIEIIFSSQPINFIYILVHVCEILDILNNVTEGDEENTFIVSSMVHVYTAAIHCMRDGTTLNQHFQGVQVFHR